MPEGSQFLGQILSFPVLLFPWAGKPADVLDKEARVSSSRVLRE